MTAAKAVIEELLGGVILCPNEEQGHLEAITKKGGINAALSDMLVAGAGFEPTTFGL